jgi:hypothetical protein
MKQVNDLMRMEINPQDLIFCQQVQGQLKQAIRMNRVQLIDLIDA